MVPSQELCVSQNQHEDLKPFENLAEEEGIGEETEMHPSWSERKGKGERKAGEPKGSAILIHGVKAGSRAFTNASEGKRDIKEKVVPLINKEGSMNR